MDKLFDAKYIDKEFEEIGKRIKKPVSVFLIGGCSMSFRGLKETTKDVDIVFKDKDNFEIFCNGVTWAQYHEPHPIKPEHKHLEPTAVYENKDGLHLDLFVKRIMGKLSLSDSMIKRTELYKNYGNLSVYLLSKEDIFLFKGLASEGRKRDLPDMEVLYPNLNWKIIEEELKLQELSNDLIASFIRRLEEFNKTYRLDIPILTNLKKVK